jgi:hypothetical protein
MCDRVHNLLQGVNIFSTVANVCQLANTLKKHLFLTEYSHKTRKNTNI